MSLSPFSRFVLALAVTVSWARASVADPAPDAPHVSITATPGKGMTFTTADERYQLNIRARFQLRDTLTDVSSLRQNQANIKTLRLFLSGYVLSPETKYFIQLAEGGGDFESTAGATVATGAVSPVFDAYVEFAQLRDLNVRIGQYFVPLDRARTIREFALQFVDRQQPVQELSLDRDVGVTAQSNDLFGLGGRLGYNVGLFGGRGKDRFGGSSPGFLYVARATVRPLGGFDDDIEGDQQHTPSPRLAFGLGVARNNHTNRAQSTLGSTFTLGNTSYTHAAADLVFKYQGFSFLSEFLYRQADDVKLVSADNRVTEWTRSARGYFAQGGLMLGNHLEVVGRFSQVLVVSPTDPSLVTLAKQQGREGGGGLNWYFNNHLLKLQADYFHYWGPVATNAKDQVRFQVDASF